MKGKNIPHKVMPQHKEVHKSMPMPMHTKEMEKRHQDINKGTKKK